MARFPRTCDVPGCDHPRRRLHRLCLSCYRRLPGEIRVGIAEAHHQRRRSDWTALCRRAADFLGIGRAAAAAPSPTAQQVYASTARRMGEPA